MKIGNIELPDNGAMDGATYTRVVEYVWSLERMVERVAMRSGLVMRLRGTWCCGDSEGKTPLEAVTKEVARTEGWTKHEQ